MNVAVVVDAVRQHLTAVQALGVEAVETHPAPRSGKARQQARIAREQLQVDHGVDLGLAHPAQKTQRIDGQGPQAGLANRHNVRFRHGGHQADAVGVPLKNQKKDFRAQRAFGLLERRVGDDGAAHLRELDK